MMFECMKKKEGNTHCLETSNDSPCIVKMSVDETKG